MTVFNIRSMIIALVFLGFTASTVQSYEPLVEKKIFPMAEFTTQGGDKIKELKVGWEAYGTLNDDKSNVILICHYFTGNSHAAGKYKIDDKSPGYWDKIIGAGMPIDTDKYYVISVDSLVNVSTGNPMVTTTGPASIDPKTGKPYGMKFPVVTIRDFIEVQKALLDSFDITSLHAVIGPSMGALQTYEWAATYPKMVKRAIPVIAPGWTNGNMIAWLNIWAAPIKLDHNWNNGNYYGGAPPLKGLAESVKILSLQARNPEWSNIFARQWAIDAADPAKNYDNLFKIEALLNQTSMDAAKLFDANHFLYLVKANQLFYAGHGDKLLDGLLAIEAPVLIIHSDDDLIFPGDVIRTTAAVIKSDGTSVEVFELPGIQKQGHLDGLNQIGLAGERIRNFLN